VTITDRMAAWRRERRVLQRVSRAAWRLEQAERERAWALVSARAEGELAIILSGQAGLLRAMLHAAPALAARFPAVIDFPGYTPAQLTAILHALAAEAGLTLTPGAARKATAVLADAENSHATGNARLAVQLLTQATTSQAHRVTTGPQPCDPAALAAVCAVDIPDRMPVPAPSPCDQHPGQYL
jgi:hypothetical protein